MDQQQGVLQITSSSPGDGKSTVAANLAVAIAAVGVRTLLVDADFWAPSQQAIFDLPNYKGLSTVMSPPSRAPNGSTELPTLPTQYKNLSLLPSGPTPAGPTELIHAQIETTIRRLRDDQSFVIVDSPPLLAVSDASLIAPHVDQVIVIVNAGHTKLTSLREAVDRLLLAKGRLSGVVLNQTADRSTPTGYYSYHRPEMSELVGSD